MPIALVCPNCETRVAAAIDAAGRKARCPKCGTAMTIPAAETTVPSKPTTDAPHEADQRIGTTISYAAGGTPPPSGPSSADGGIVGASTSAGRRFMIVRQHAEGGLGKVYVALDQELRREVALKEIKDRHADDADSRARFVLEAEITGGLEHPGIVPIYGLGKHADGRPFYAMRFIRGDSLKDAIACFHQNKKKHGEDALELRKLLGRFIAVCEAIQYAHDRGVIHRDLKPANIMLGKYGETLVVDWGLAKALDANDAAPSQDGASARLSVTPRANETVAGAAVGTPAFMSPEQAAGRVDLVGPASDVYSLGATLYVLLTNKMPFTGSDPSDTMRMVQAGQFHRPRKINPAIAAALEAICLKAMARERQDRYASPHALAEDLEHWLADEPVRAWPEPWTVRTGRWVRRHKPLVSSAAAALIVGVAAAVGGLLWYQEEENRRAVETADRRRDAKTKLAITEQGIRAALTQAKAGRADLQASLAKRGGVFSLLNDPARWRARVEAGQAPLDRAQALLANAGPDVDQSLPDDAQKLRDLLRQDDADRLLAIRLDDIRLEKADQFIDDRFDFTRTRADYADALKKAGFDPVNGEPGVVAARIAAAPIKEQLVAALDDWAFCAWLVPAERQRADRLLAISRTAAPDPAWGDRVRRVDLWSDKKALDALVQEKIPAGASPQLLGLVGTSLADELSRQAWLREAQIRYPGDFWLSYDLGTALLKADPAEAVGFLRVALVVRPSSSVAHLNVATIYHRQRRYHDAVAAFRKAIELDPKSARCYAGLSLSLANMGDLSEATAVNQKGKEVAPHYSMNYVSLGEILSKQSKSKEAEAAYRKAVELDQKNWRGHVGVGVALREQRKNADAMSAFRQALAITQREGNVYLQMGICLLNDKNFAEAEAAFHKGIELDPKLAVQHLNLGKVLSLQNRLGESVVAHRRAIELDPTSGPAHFGLATALMRQGFSAQAVPEYKKALQIPPIPNDVMDGLRPVFANLGIEICEENLAREKQVQAIRAGRERARPDDLIVIAKDIRDIEKLQATAIWLFGQAFAAQPDLADDPVRHWGFVAAQAAARAGTSDVHHAGNLSEEEKSELRLQAHTWLQGRLDWHRARLDASDVKMIRHFEWWLAEPNLACVRDAVALAKLPPNEAKRWQDFWAEHAKLLKQLKADIVAETIQGVLTDKEPAPNYDRQLPAGAICVIDMKSKEVDSFLKLFDATGKLCAENDDIDGTLDSRIVYAPSARGMHRISAGSFGNRGRGAYTLTIQIVPDNRNAALWKAIEAAPQSAQAYFELGRALATQDRLPDAVVQLQKALALDPKHAVSHLQMGAVLWERHKLADAARAFAKAIELEPTNPLGHVGQGNVLVEQRQYKAARASFEKAISLNAKEALGYAGLGNALRFEGKLNEAAAACRKGVELDPKNAETHLALALVLLDQGDFQASADALQQASALMIPGQPRRRLADAAQVCRRLRFLDTRLTAVREGGGQLRNIDLLDLAHFCLSNKKFRVTAANFYQKVFQSQPAFADEPAQTNRYNAACAAVLAGCGQGGEAAQLSEADKTKWRRQGHAWLRAHLDSSVRRFREVKVDDFASIEFRLQWWQTDADLFHVRAKDALTKLPADERIAWEKLWADVDETLSRVRAVSLKTFEGRLTDDLRTATHEISLKAGVTYVLHARSDDIECLAEVKDAAGKKLGFSPVAQRGFQEARFAFTPSADGVYRVEATTLSQRERGPYTLTIGEYQKVHWPIVAELNGKLGAGTPIHEHSLPLKAGTPCLIDMKSADFNSHLKMFDAAGKMVAVNDDIAPGNPDSRIQFVPARDGVYRVVASSFGNAGRGAYTLSIRVAACKE